MESRELFLTAKACAMQFKKPIPLGSSAHLYFINGYRKWIARNDETGNRIEMDDERARLLRNSLFYNNTDTDYASIPATDELCNLFKGDDWEYMIANNSAGTIHVVEKGIDCKICELNSCTHFVVDLKDKKVYIERLFCNCLCSFLDGGVEYLDAKAFRMRMHDTIVYRSHVTCTEATTAMVAKYYKSDSQVELSDDRKIVLALVELYNKESEDSFTFNSLRIAKELPDSQITAIVNELLQGTVDDILKTIRYNTANLPATVCSRLKACLAIMQDVEHVVCPFKTIEGLYYFRMLYGEVAVPFVLCDDIVIWKEQVDLPVLLEDLVSKGEDDDAPWIPQYVTEASVFPRTMSLDEKIERAKRDWDALGV